MSIDDKKLKACPKITDVSVTEKGEIRLRWTETLGADKYAVKRADSPDGEYGLVAWVKDTEYTDTAVKRDFTYWYKVVALKVIKGKRNSKKTSPVVAKVVSAIAAPEAVRAVNKSGKIKLVWKSPEEATAFLIYRRNEYFYQMMPIAVAEGDSFIDRDIVQGQLYHYSVQSLVGERRGNFSDEVSCVCLDCGEIVDFKSRLFRRVDLQARIVAGADGYIFERSEDGESFTEIARTDSDVMTKYTDKADKAFSFYYYRVRAYKKIDGEMIITKPSEAVKIKTK